MIIYNAYVNGSLLSIASRHSDGAVTLTLFSADLTASVLLWSGARVGSFRLSADHAVPLYVDIIRGRPLSIMLSLRGERLVIDVDRRGELSYVKVSIYAA